MEAFVHHTYLFTHYKYVERFSKVVAYHGCLLRHNRLYHQDRYSEYLGDIADS